MDDIKKALEAKLQTQVGGMLQVEDLGVTLNQVTFNMNNLTPWPHIDLYEGYEIFDLHGKLKIGGIHYSDVTAIYGMFKALADVRIIRDAAQPWPERLVVDSRPYYVE